tara:strand:+ start:1455 stop:1778 length:324 start_codon:yes stop_codon:yes gene_type:complete
MKKNSELKKVAHITYTDNYGTYKDQRAWLIKETINGKPNGDPYLTKVAKREHFIRLHEIVLDYLEKGWEIEIKNDKTIKPSKERVKKIVEEDMNKSINKIFGLNNNK